MKFVVELHGCDRLGGEGFLMNTYITWVYTISATGFWDTEVRKERGGGHKYDSHTSVI